MEDLNSRLNSLEAATMAEDLIDFDESARKLSEDRSLADRYDQQWVAVYGGEIAASAADMDELLRQLSEACVPASKAVIRFIERKERTLIL